MSLAIRCQTCSACGGPIGPHDAFDVEPLVDASIRHIPVHPTCSTFPPARPTQREVKNGHAEVACPAAQHV